MKIPLIILTALLAIPFIFYVIMAIQSHKRPDALGLQGDALHPCPATPNCVCSETFTPPSAEHVTTPIELKENTWNQLKDRIIHLGGNIEFDDGNYLHATFTSIVFRYIDDVELRLDTANKHIHIRSASRVGRSDFGVNRKRIEKIKQHSN